jgi:DNA-binding transcriptional LysR family regulator
MRDTLAIDLNLMRALNVLLEERNVTRAAARLHISQPSLSAQLAKLRNLFSDPLLVPSGRTLVPTARAMEMQAGLRAAIEQLHATVLPMPFDAATSERVFALAASDYSQFAIVAPLVERLRKEARKVRIDVRTLSATTMASQLEREEITIALTLPTSASADLHTRILFSDKYVCIVRKDHPLIGRKKLTLARICEFDHLVVSPRGGTFSDELEEVLASNSLSRRVVASMQSFLLAPMLVARTDLVALVPSRVGTFGRDDLVQMPLPVPSRGFTLAAIWHDRMHRDAGHRWLRGLIHDVCSDPVATASISKLT